MLIEYKEIIHETPKAYLIKLDDKFQCWIPKALIEDSKDKIIQVYNKFEMTKIRIPQPDDVMCDFEDISDKGVIPEEPDFSEVVKRSLEKYPTPFD